MDIMEALWKPPENNEKDGGSEALDQPSYAGRSKNCTPIPSSLDAEDKAFNNALEASLFDS